MAETGNDAGEVDGSAAFLAGRRSSDRADGRGVVAAGVARVSGVMSYSPGICWRRDGDLGLPDRADFRGLGTSRAISQHRHVACSAEALQDEVNHTGVISALH